jgi:hypothetical protein
MNEIVGIKLNGNEDEILVDNKLNKLNREEDIAEFASFIGFSLNKKKKKMLLEMETKAYESFKFGNYISKCCKV